MREVKIYKKELVDKLQINRQEHRKLFEAALEGYRKEVVKQLENRLTDAKEGKHVDLFICLEQPVDQTKDYDRVLEMLEMEVEDTVSLTHDEFKCYVMDDWSWKDQFLATNSRYTS